MQVRRLITSIPFHVAGLILFFLSHGYNQYFGLISFQDLFLYFLVMIFLSFLGMLLFRKLLSSYLKAGLITTFILALYLFFGAILDTFKDSWLLGFIGSYTVLIPLSIVVLTGFYYYLKKSRRNFRKITGYLNALFFLIILLDLVLIVSRSYQLPRPSTPVKEEISTKYPACTNCPTPDVFLLVMDEYCGSNSLKTYFNYNNFQFELFLRSKGFFVAANPSSNYMATSLSMASTFNMTYLSWRTGRQKIMVEDYTKAEESISKSDLLQIFRSLDYTIKNYSIFKIANQPSQFNPGLLPTNLELITFKTLFNRMNKDLGWHLHQKLAPRVKWFANYFQNNFKEGNEKLLKLTRDIASSKTINPKFVYTHLVMPHYPALYDSTGKEVKINFYDSTISKAELDQAYLQYLVYTNKVISDMVNHIQTQTQNQAVIILMSDHGYRGVPNDGISSSNNNFISVFIPSGNYKGFYDTISNVNLFRSTLNSLFRFNMPLLKDSVIN